MSVILESASLNKIFLFSLFVPFLILSDDLKIADDFIEGDVVSAETFNQIFDDLEKINRTVKDEDLLGTWLCTSVFADSGFSSTYSNGGWVTKGFIEVLPDIQVTFTSSFASGGTIPIGASSFEYPYSFSTSFPTPFYKESVGTYENSADTGTYILHKGIMFLKGIGLNAANQNRVAGFVVDIISDSRIVLTPSSGAANLPESITCDSAIPVPASPTSLTAINAQSSINLSWTDSSTGEQGFRIYRKQEGNSEYSLLGTLTSTLFEDTDTSEGVSYSYYVTSYNENGESKKSKIVSATLDSIKPSVVSTVPTDGQNYSGTTVTITFSEVIEIKCPAGAELIGAAQGNNCNSFPAIKLVGSSNTYYMGQIGEKGISISGQPFVDGANPSYSVTVSKEHIFDLNGNKMEEDFSFSFTDG